MITFPDLRAEAPAGSTTAGSQASGLTALADQNTFLKLLVEQVQHQDPLNPQDPIEFVTQLTQFSQLEALLGMRKSLEVIQGSLTSPGAQDTATQTRN